MSQIWYQHDTKLVLAIKKEIFRIYFSRGWWIMVKLWTFFNNLRLPWLEWPNTTKNKLTMNGFISSLLRKSPLKKLNDKKKPTAVANIIKEKLMMVVRRFVLPWTLKQRYKHYKGFDQGLAATVVNLLLPWSVWFFISKGVLNLQRNHITYYLTPNWVMRAELPIIWWKLQNDRVSKAGLCYCGMQPKKIWLNLKQPFLTSYLSNHKLKNLFFYFVHISGRFGQIIVPVQPARQ